MEIKPYEKNAKKHTKKQVAQIAASIKEFGFHQPIVVDKEGVIIVGHGRYEALQSLGMEIMPDMVRVADLTEEQARAYRLADNKLNESEWDSDLLLEDLKLLSPGIFDLTGFDKDLLITGDEKDDDVPEAPPEPQSEFGDLYELGDHRVLCGDSTKVECVERLMTNQNVELLFTSPPYSDMREYNGEKDLSVSNLSVFIPVFEKYAKYQVVNLGIQRKNGEIYEYWNEYIAKAREVGYKFLSWNIWRQDGAGSIGKQSAFFPIEHEWIFVFGREFKDIKRTEQKKQDRKRTESTHTNPDGTREKHAVGRVERLKELGTVIELPSDKTAIRLLHPAVYPVMLPEKFILTMTESKDVVIDPFLGSGSTLIAAEKTGRICYGMELDPKYTDVVITRWCEYTGIDTIKKNGESIVWQSNK